MIGGVALAIQMTAATPSRMTERDLAAIEGSYGSTDSHISRSNVDIAAQIDAVVQNPDNYEVGEPRPNAAAIASLKSLLLGVIVPRDVPVAISSYYGEIDATWRKDNRMLRLVAFSDGRVPLLYVCTDSGEALARGETLQPVTQSQISAKMAWLIG